MFLLLPFDSLVVNLLGISITVLFTLLLVFIIVPAIFGVSFGIRKVYMKTLLKIFQVSRVLNILSVGGQLQGSRQAQLCWEERLLPLSRTPKVAGTGGWFAGDALLPADPQESSQPNTIYWTNDHGLVFFFPVIKPRSLQTSSRAGQRRQSVCR